MATARVWHLLRVACLGGLVLTRAAPAAAAFNLDYEVTGRIWVASLAVPPVAAPATTRTVLLRDFGVCEEPRGTREQLLEPRNRDCRFERQLAEALDRSGVFPRLNRSAPSSGEFAFAVEPRRSRVAFHRRVIPGVKPLLVLTLFTYLWTPLPFEVDEESYDLRVAILDPRGHLLSEVAVARAFTHHLSAYSPERNAPADLLAALEPTERDLAPVVVCRGPHAHLAVAELIQQVAVALRSSEMRDHGDPHLPSAENAEAAAGRRRHIAIDGQGRGAGSFPRPGDAGLRRALCGRC